MFLSLLRNATDEFNELIIITIITISTLTDVETLMLSDVSSAYGAALSSRDWGTAMHAHVFASWI
jgi:hypothetical protein